MNPYKNLPDKNFWKSSVAGVAKHEMDPVTEVKFKIKPADKVITAGSCFAQHIARELQRNKFNYYITEQNNELTPEQRSDRSYGTYSARYGNIYTTTQFLQLIMEALGEWQPLEKTWQHKRGFYVDPYRPRIEPRGFATEAEVLTSRKTMLAAVKKMITDADILVFTLGLTEAWRSKQDGAVYPLAPGVFGGEFDAGKHEFVNFNVAQTVTALRTALEKIKAINRKIKVIVTVSPVPLAATYEDKHVLVSNTYSKAVLRIAAEELSTNQDWIQYFPSFEIITGNHAAGSYYEDDLREVATYGVKHVMRCFLNNLTDGVSKAKPVLVEERYAEINCDEDEIAQARV